MSLGRIAIVGYVVFLAFYSWYKYSVAAPQEFSAAYAQSTAILVLMTGVAPFLIAFAVLKASGLKRLSASFTGLIIGMLACVAGYAAFWWFFIVPNGNAPAVLEVATRGIGWGLLQGALASIAANH